MNVDAQNDANGKVGVRLDGNASDITAGGKEAGQDGALILKNAAGNEVVSLGRRRFGGPSASNIPFVQLRLANDAGDRTILLSGSVGNALIGGNGTDGSLHLLGGNNKAKMELNTQAGNANIIVHNNSDKEVIRLNLDGSDNGGKANIIVRNRMEKEAIRLDLDGSNPEGNANLIVRDRAEDEVIRFDLNGNDGKAAIIVNPSNRVRGIRLDFEAKRGEVTQRVPLV